MAEDSTFEGWTTPLGAMPYPDVRVLPGSPHPKGRIGEVRSQTKADDASIKYASRYWPRRYVDEFGIEGRTWIDYATKTEHRLCRRNVLAGLGLDGGYSLAAVAGTGQLTPVPPRPQ